jgi:hypothetical protein
MTTHAHLPDAGIHDHHAIDALLPAPNQHAALAGTPGTPSAANPYLTADHADDVDVHHAKYTDAEAQAVADTQIATHATDSDAHHDPIPTGVIVMWGGAVLDIPTGWALCDGQDSRPDLRDRFVVGAGSTHNPTDTGGQAATAHTHPITEQAAHRHNIQADGDHTHTISSDGAHTHTAIGGGAYERGLGSGAFSGIDVNGSFVNTTSSDGSHDHDAATGTDGSHNHAGKTALSNNHDHGAATGAASDDENRPPYYALCFIIKT